MVWELDGPKPILGVAAARGNIPVQLAQRGHTGGPGRGGVVDVGLALRGGWRAGLYTDLLIILIFE